MKNVDKKLIEKNIIVILGKYLDYPGEICANDLMEAIGMNSIAFVQVIVEIEALYDLNFDDLMLDYKSFERVSDLISLVS